MSNGIEDLRKLDEEAARLVATTLALTEGGHFEETLPLIDGVDHIITNLRTSIERLRSSGAMTRREAAVHLKDLEVKRAHNDTRRAVSLRGLGRNSEAKAVYRDLLTRTHLPDLNAFSTMLNLATLHGDQGEKRQAWEAFRQAERYHERMGGIQGAPQLIDHIRGQLTRKLGQPPKRRRRK